MYLLAYYFLKNHFTAWISGLMFVFNFYIFDKLGGHLNYTSTWIISFFILFFVKIFQENKKKNALIAGTILSLSFYNDFYYSIGLLIFSASIILWIFFKNKKLLLSKIKNIFLCFFYYI